MGAVLKQRNSGGVNGTYRALMWVSCARSSTDVTFGFERYMGPDLWLGTFRYRVDDGMIHTTTSSSFGNQFVGFKQDKSIEMLNRIVSGKTLVISAPLEKLGEVEASFPIEGAAAVVADVRKDCNW